MERECEARVVLPGDTIPICLDCKYSQTGLCARDVIGPVLGYSNLGVVEGGTCTKYGIQAPEEVKTVELLEMRM